MTALAESLLAAQRQAIAALSKARVAGSLEDDDLVEQLNRIGASDLVDQVHLLAALDVLATFGAPTPNGPAPSRDPETEPATDRQMSFLASLADEKGTLAPDRPLTKAQASQAISELQNGSYDPDKYRVPF